MFVSDGSGAFSVPMQPPVAPPAQFYPGFQGVDHLQARVASMTVAQCSVPGQQKCAIPECPRPSYMEKNGKVHKCCGRTHARELEKRQSQQKPQTQQGVAAPTATGQLPGQLHGQKPGQTPVPGQVPRQAPVPGQAPPGQASSGPQTVPTLPSGLRKCAIQECQNPCFVDPAGTVHECCGITHAMEHQRRKAIEQQKQVIKGVTHCLLPECNQIVWPFKNYCGRTHADIGHKRGLEPPAPPPADPSVPKDSSLCIIPGCSSKKYSDPSGVTHPYCGKTHAELGKKMNILPTADKQEDQCELPGCKAPRRKEGGRVHEYCCQSHAQQDAPNRAGKCV
ncbi:hypothetical protein GBAR_LOCUS11343 [Geodia barretti]|nr:hypothetical protein GBAR_LOCUS11343 [Geodia barretti]